MHCVKIKGKEGRKGKKGRERGRRREQETVVNRVISAKIQSSRDTHGKEAFSGEEGAPFARRP